MRGRVDGGFGDPDLAILHQLRGDRSCSPVVERAEGAEDLDPDARLFLAGVRPRLKRVQEFPTGEIDVVEVRQRPGCDHPDRGRGLAQEGGKDADDSFVAVLGDVVDGGDLVVFLGADP